MVRPTEVSEEEILEAAEALLEQEGSIGKVSARKVVQTVGGGNQRVSRIIRQWKEERSQGPRLQEVEQVSSPVPDAVTYVIEEANAKIAELGPLVARLIDTAIQTERRRSEMAVASEREAARAAVEAVEQRLQEAADNGDEFAGDLDEALKQSAELASQVETLHASLAQERSEVSRLSAEVERLEASSAEVEGRAVQAETRAAETRELYERAERARSDLETRIGAISEAHATALKDERDARRSEFREMQEAFGARAVQAEAAAEEAIAQLREAKETVAVLEKRLREASSEGRRRSGRPAGSKSSTDT